MLKYSWFIMLYIDYTKNTLYTIEVLHKSVNSRRQRLLVSMLKAGYNKSLLILIKE